jgi:hypothetical protein
LRGFSSGFLNLYANLFFPTIASKEQEAEEARPRKPQLYGQDGTIFLFEALAVAFVSRVFFLV